jgi:hypothetical protein
MTEKECSKCKITKPICDFYAQKQPFGCQYRPRCKTCTSVDNKNQLQKHKHRRYKVRGRRLTVDDQESNANGHWYW